MLISQDKDLTVKDFYKVIFKNEKLEISKDTDEAINKNFEFLKDFSKEKIIYGINTGLGPMAQYRIEEDKLKELQLNLIRSHASGAGNPIDKISVKSAMISRLNCLCKGYSGIHPEAIHLIKELINNDITPYIPEHGGVGASGDLVQLAHLALALIGEGEVLYQDKWQPTAEVFKKFNLKPIGVHIREGLALINGTAFMSGIGMVNLIHSRNLINWMLIASVLINEIVESFDDHYSKELNTVKLHHGQQIIASIMRKTLSSSKLTRKRQDELFENHISEKYIAKKVQEYYSLRCVPQILGPIYDTLINAENVLENEVNSVNDNPVIDMENNSVFHGGNFHGDYVSLEMDKLKIACSKLSMLSERQLNFLLNNKINEILPPFVNLGVLGLNLGMQGAQFTATSTVAENQTLSNPVYVHSIPNNNENQDVVSMGTNAALMSKKVIENSFEILSIELITLLQAIDYLDFKDKLSDYNKETYKNLRNIVSCFKEDHAIYQDIKNIKNYIINNRPELI